MLDSSRIGKASENKMPMLIKKIKSLKLKEISDLYLVNQLSESVYSEWLNMRCKYGNKLRKEKIINEYLHLEYEAKEELIVSLLTLLNQKIINFILPMSEKNIFKK